MTEWLALMLAGAFEIAWAFGLKQSEGFTRVWPSVGTIVAVLLSFMLMGYSLKSIPFGTAYAIWAGIGAAGTTSVGILVFGEPAGTARLLCVGLIAAGIVGLKLATPD